MAAGKMGKNNAVIVAGRIKQQKCHELRLAGFTWEQIAAQVGYTSPAAAYVSWKRALDRIPAEAVHETRRMEADRLDKLQRTVWTEAIKSKDTKTIALILKIMQRRAMMLGLDLAKPMNAEEIATTVAAITVALDQAEIYPPDNNDEDEDNPGTEIEDLTSELP